MVRRIDRHGILRDVVRARTGIKQPYGVAIDAADRLFVTEWAHGRIRRVDPDGSLATVLNIRDEFGTDAFGPAIFARSAVGNGMAFDERGDLFYADTESRIMQVRAVPGPGGRLIRPRSSIREVARLAPPFEEVTDRIAAHAGKVYVEGAISGALFEIDVATGERRTLAGGDGTLGEPSGLALDAERGRIFVADSPNGRIVTVDVATGAVSHFVDLPLNLGFFYNVHLALSDDLLFASNDLINQVHVVDTAASEPSLELYAGIELGDAASTGDGGPALAATFAQPQGIEVDSAGKLLVAERFSGRIRVIGTSDLVPGTYPNVIRARSRKRVEVAIEGTPQLDATRLVASSITVAGARTGHARIRDVNHDGRKDLVVKVRQSDLARGLAPGERQAAIEGRLRGGRPFGDADWVTVVR